MLIARLETIMSENAYDDAIIYDDVIYNYLDVKNKIDQWLARIESCGIRPGDVVSVTGEYSADAIAVVIALVKNRNILVPVSPVFKAQYQSYWNISQTQFVIDLNEDEYDIQKIEPQLPAHELLSYLIDNNKPGLVLFTSGSTGEPKAVVHDFDRLLSKFKNADKKFRTLCFLMIDHIAGIDTYFYSLFSGGTAILPSSRDPEDICQLIEQFKVEVLPTSPTFLNLLLLSEAYWKYDLSSLKIITFGSERMPEFLLKRVQGIFKGVRVIQKYGVTELGSPASKSKTTDTSWIKLDGDKFKTKIIDGILYVKTDTAMLGYLNAHSPFNEDGWFNTGDSVIVDGDYIKICGRESEIINVGGEKVFPAEVENTIQQMDNVADVTVYAEKNPIVGHIVCAKVLLAKETEQKQFTAELKQFCRDKLEPFKIPVKIQVVDNFQHNTRYKKVRRHA